MEAIAAKSMATIDTFVMQNLSNTAWAFAPLGFRNKPLMDAISAAALPKWDEFVPQEISNLAWSCAKIGLADHHFLAALAAASLKLMSEFLTQDLANSSWSCATLTYVDCPLFSSISEEAIRKLAEFERQELSNTAWAFAKFEWPDRNLSTAIAEEAKARIDLFDAQALSNLCDSIPHCAQELFQRLLPTIEEFVGGMPESLDGWRGGSFADVLHRIMVDNFGAMGTQVVLARLGLQDAGSDFIAKAQHRIGLALAEVDARKEGFGLSHKRVLCFAEWDLGHPSGEQLRGTLLMENGIRVGHVSPPAWLRSHATPINHIIGRDLCGEFQLLTGVGLILDAAPPGRLVGTLLMYVSSTPCVSCVAAIRQFQQRYPGLTLAFANGERLPGSDITVLAH